MPAPFVQSATATIDGCYVVVDGRRARVESKDFLLNDGFCLLIDQDADLHFSVTYTARWPGNEFLGIEPLTLEGGTDSAQVAALFEDYLSRLPIGRNVVDLPVPTEEAAQAALPALRIERYKRDLNPV